jgi:hypothetical protein
MQESQKAADSEKMLDFSLNAGYGQPMKIAKRTTRKQKVDLRSECFTLSNAKTYLGRLIERARKGEPVYILKGQHRFILQQAPVIDPIPIRPPGYFAECYSKAEIREENLLAKSSVVRPPKDLE